MDYIEQLLSENERLRAALGIIARMNRRKDLTEAQQIARDALAQETK